MKKYWLFLLAITVIQSAGCSYYSIVKDSAPSGEIKAYDSVTFGWIDLGEDRWKTYGYEESNKGQWADTIIQMNKESMPQYLRECLPNKKTITMASKKDVPKGDGLIVTFSDAVYEQRTSSGARMMFGPMAGSDTLGVTVHFTDGKTSKEIYSVRVCIYSKSGGGFSDNRFEGRVNNAIYNLVHFISGKLK